jgi:enamine deaminase RidA (YjgF/YER057c/UK114 family)
MKRIALIATAALIAGAAHAEDVVRVGAPTSPIASVVVAPAGYDVVYVSGMVPPVVDPKAPAGSTGMYGDTKTQTVGVIGRLADALKTQGLTLADVTMMRVYLVGDPAKEGKMDFAGMMAGYTQFFGTAAQPNKPSRVTVQVSSLVGPGMLVEIEVQAAKPHAAPAH